MGVPEALAAVLWRLLTELWWHGYEIGETAARELADYDGAVQGVEALIASQGHAWLNQIIGTLLDRIEDVLSEHADADADELAHLITDVLGDRASAERIATTETTRASTAAAADTYRAAGIYQVDWTVEDDNACPECLANQAASPQTYGNPFPSGDIAPPAHPNCRCALLPVRG